MELSPIYQSRLHREQPSTKSIRLVGPSSSVPNFQAMKAEWKGMQPHRQELNYSATMPSQFRRRRDNLGGQADAHLAQEFRYWELREYARDMDRNDIIVGQLFDKACDNVLGSGLVPHPATGDEPLNNEIRLMWEEWATDRRLCDYAWRHPFFKLERFALRGMHIDGDHFAIFRNEQLQLFEGDRVASPDNLNDDVVHGIVLDPKTDRVLKYLFLNYIPGTRKQRVRRTPLSVDSKDITAVPAFDEQGWPNVLHIYDPKRLTQTRGITALAPCFDLVGMFEDINFARLVQQQVVSCIAAFIQSERDNQWGNRQEQDEDDGSTTTLEELTPGLVHRLRPGEKIEGFSPGVPGPEFQEHVRLILRLIGGVVGMPLELVMMDTSDTTFHGYRGVLQMARRGFVRQHMSLISTFHRPIYEHLLRSWLPKLGRAASKNREIYRHAWQVPGFPYVDPKVEAEADKVRLQNLLISPRRLHAEQGNDFDAIYKETIEDNGKAIDEAQAKADELNKRHKDLEFPINWRDILNMDHPAGSTRQVKETNEAPPAPGAAPKGAPKKEPK